MINWPGIDLGIPPQKEPKDLNEMRRAIDKAGRGCSVIRHVLDNARYQGLSGEDTYVMLAYYALRQLNAHYKLNMRWLSCSPNPGPFVVKDPEAP